MLDHPYGGIYFPALNLFLNFSNICPRASINVHVAEPRNPDLHTAARTSFCLVLFFFGGGGVTQSSKRKKKNSTVITWPADRQIPCYKFPMLVRHHVGILLPLVLGEFPFSAGLVPKTLFDWWEDRRIRKRPAYP